MNPRYSVQEIARRRRGSKRQTRDERRARLRSWAGMAQALMQAKGIDTSKYSTGELAMIFYRRRKQSVHEVSAKRNAAAGRAATLKSLPTLGRHHG